MTTETVIGSKGDVAIVIANNNRDGDVIWLGTEASNSGLKEIAT